MDVLSSTASVVAVIQLTGSLVNICGGYIREVKDARKEIITLQRAFVSLQGILQDLEKLLESHNNTLPSSSRLAGDITDCFSDLRALEKELDPGKGKTTMRKMGLRALKWPLKRTDMEGIVQNLERYKSCFTLSLQLDQTTLITGLVQDADNLNQMTYLDKLPFAHGAEFNSYPDQHEDECLQGTRTELLQQITEWAVSPHAKCVFWLNGMAGTGKSTISRTVARSLKETKRLGASFFFKRGEVDRENAVKLFPTLARQLVLSFPGLGAGVQKALSDDPDVASKSLREQFDKLLLQPLLDYDQLDKQPQAAVIVIDALDECEIDQDVENIIRLLPSLQRAPATRLRIFLTSRPEPPIRLGFSKIANDNYQDLALHDIPEQVTKHDIYLFLKDKFAKIRHDRGISRDWPSDEIIQDIVTMSVPLFISAATVIRYIESSKWEPQLRLRELLKDQARYATKMDKTYLPILTRLLDDQENDESEQQQLLQEFQDIVGAIILLAIPFTINALSEFLRVSPDFISNRLDSFQSVLSVSKNRDMPIRMLHLSFRDFLVQSKSRFRVEEPKKHMDIAIRCLLTMRGLKKNICELKGYGAQRTEIDTKYIHQQLPPELQYSCRYWVHHLAQSRNVTAATEDVFLFLHEHFLHWMEAMSFLGAVSELVGIIDQLQLIINDCRLSKFLHDGKRFVLKNRQIADQAPLQIYNSGLTFAPRTSIIRKVFEKDLPSWICNFPKVEETWSAEIQTLEGHSGSVQSVAFCPDGRILATGSSDKMVRLWDTATGVLQQTFDGHSEPVQSVSFSPQGRVLASGSNDQTVKLWNTATGELLQTLNGHYEPVQSVAFSLDGRYLASGSNDRTVKLWDTATGELSQTFDGHWESVQSVVFSSDGRYLASGSNDKTVKLWNTATGALQQTFEGHLDSVHSVAFSPDCRLLASSSRDETLKLWDTDTGALRHSLDGHSDSIWYPDWVASVAFSLDGRLLVSGSNDRIVRLWDTATGVLQQALRGHSHCVQSVAFSPDGRILASGSKDKTVKLWDITTGTPLQTHEGHSDWVWSLAFSSDSRLLASTSSDKTVRLWDTTTGVLLRTLEGHSRCVQSVAFSPDGRFLASSSNDETVRFWDTATGTPQQILDGHLGRVYCVVFSRDGGLLASGSSDKTVRLWDVARGMWQKTLDGHSDEVRCVIFSSDGRYLASGSSDRTVKLWDAATGALQLTLYGHSDDVRSVAFSPDGRLLASSSDDKTVRFWDSATGALQQILGTKGKVTSLEFTEDGSHLDTNLGYLEIQAGSLSPHENDGILSLDSQWITFYRSKLWLPSEYRPWCSAIKGTTLALGHESGRISIIGFCDSGCQ